MDEKFRKITLLSGALFAGLLFYLYILFITVIFFNNTPAQFPGLIKFRKEELALFIIFSSIFLFASTLYSLSYFLKQKVSFKPKYDIIKFLLYSIFFGLMVSLIKIFTFSSMFSLFTKTIVIITGVFIIIFPMLNINKFVLKLIFINLFTKSIYYNETEKIFEIYEIPEFINRGKSLINQAQRYNLNLGIIVIYIKNLFKLEKEIGKSGSKFLRKQLIFLLTQNSRLYEVWGRTQDKNIYIEFIQVKKEYELRYAVERFYKLINNYEFIMYNKKINPEIKLMGIFSETKEIDNSDKGLNEIIKRAINKIALQKEEIIISKGF